jgi:hypothetical protein
MKISGSGREFINKRFRQKRNSTAAADEKKNKMKNFSDQENIQKTFRYKHLKYTQ